MRKIKVVGIGPGAIDYIAPAALKAIEACDLVIGGKRNLEALSFLNKRSYEFTSGMDKLAELIEKERQEKDVCIAVSGDPGFYSMLDFLKKSFGSQELEVIPGISSFQYLFCKLARPWKDYSLVSMHGRSADIGRLAAEGRGMFFLTDKSSTPASIAQELLSTGSKGYRMIIGENLSYEDERITAAALEEVLNMVFSDLCVVVVDRYEMEL